MLRLTHLLKEQIVDNKVICDKCGWRWSITDGGDDTYTCHKCGNDNTPINETNISGLEKRIKQIQKVAAKENIKVEQEHDFDRDMVVGVAEILRMVDDIDNRAEIADRMMDKFDDEDVNYDAGEFMSMSGVGSANEEQTPTAPMLDKPKVPTSSKGTKKAPIQPSTKPKNAGDKIKNLQLRIKIMRDTLKLPKSSQSKTKIQRRIVKANQRLSDLKKEK